MVISLTPEQRQAVEAAQGAVFFIDPQTQCQYVLMRADLFEQSLPAVQVQPAAPECTIPPGIRRSQEALRRDLPELLKKKKLWHQWVAYYGDERIGIARTERELILECMRRGLRDDEYYVSWIDELELIEEEEIEPFAPDLLEGSEDFPDDACPPS
jgi:hypothetical protein